MSISKKIKVGIIGLGMVGEPIRRWFEEYHKYRRGKELFCYDADPKKSYSDDINRADAIFVAVPTPPNPDGSCNVSIVRSAVATIDDGSPRSSSGPLRRSFSEASGAGKIVIIKSTVPPGTVETLQKQYPRKKFIFNPEFLTESQSWLDYIKPDRQIVGYTDKSFSDVKEVLTLLPRAHFERPWSSDYVKKDINVTEAELAKYAANAFGYIKVIYGNILADLSHALSADFKNKKIKASVDYENVRETIAADPRIGPAWLNVDHGNYCGAGGYCFPKDMAAFIKFAENLTASLAKNKKTDVGVIKTLKGGIGVLRSIQNYNKTLLSWQGLSMADVSYHDKELVLNKRKKIRSIS